MFFKNKTFLHGATARELGIGSILEALITIYMTSFIKNSNVLSCVFFKRNRRCMSMHAIYRGCRGNIET